MSTEQPAPTPNEHPSIHDIVRENFEQTVNPTPWRQRVLDELASRKQRGLDTYGTVLQPGNGRDAAQDAFEEALDTVVYLKQLELEAEESGDYQAQFYASTLYDAAAALCTRVAYAMHRREIRA